MGVSERKGDRSVTAGLERKGNGRLYGGTERNHLNQTGSLVSL